MGARAVVVGVLVTAAAGGAGLVITSGGGGGLPALGVPSCAAGAVNVTTSSAASSNLASGNDVCVTASIGNLSLNGGSWTSPAVEKLGTSGAGEIGLLFLNGVVGLEVSVRADWVLIPDAQSVTIQSSKLGGDAYNDRSWTCDYSSPPTSCDVGGGVAMLNDPGCDDCVIQDTEIGWTKADNGGNTGYGIHATGDNDNLIIRRNWIHDLGSDGIQGAGGDNVVIDRNEIGPVGQTPGSSEHSDIIQITGNDAGMQITNNYLHQQGYYNSSGSLAAGDGGAGNIYIHGGSIGSLLMDNNLLTDSRGRTEFCGLGTGGVDRQNLTVTNNTWDDLGQRTDGAFASLEWDCDTGSSNLFQYNVSVDSHGGLDDAGAEGSVSTWSNNLFGALSLVTLDGDGNCTSSNCNPGGHTIGFRKPSGVHW